MMVSFLKACLTRLSHAICWGILVLLAFIVALFVWASYGIPGAWVQAIFDAKVPAEAGQVSVEWLAYRPGQGLVVEGFEWRDAMRGRVLARCDRAKVRLSLLNFKPLSKRLEAVELERLYVAQLRHGDELDDPRGRYQPRRKAVDFSAVDLDLEAFSLVLHAPSVLEVEAERVLAQCKAKGKQIYVNDIVVEMDAQAKVKGEVTVDFEKRYVDLALVGRADHRQLNGVYRALDFEIIEAYNNLFHLQAPAFADAKIRVGLDKFENIFDLSVAITVPSEGDYNGVKFDEATGTVRSQNIWGTVTEIKDIVARRRGDVVARGQLRFDCLADCFSFKATADGLMPEDYYRLIGLPFVEVLPQVECVAFPTAKVEGALPLVTPQQLRSVVLREGYFRSNGPCSVKDYHAEGVEMSFSMANGTFEIPQLTIDVGPTKQERIVASLKVTPEPLKATVDIYAKAETEGISLKYVRASLAEKLGEDATFRGNGELYCQTGEAFRSTLWGNFNVVVTGKKLARFNFFSKMTDFMAAHIPGIASITDVDELYAQGSVRDGIVDFHRLRLEGALPSIEGLGRYNLVTDEIKGSFVVGFINEDSYLGKATRLIFFPVARAMWQVHVGGTRKQPTWDFKSIVGTMSDFVLGKESAFDTLKKDAEKVEKDRSEHETEKEDGAFTDLFFGEE